MATFKASLSPHKRQDGTYNVRVRVIHNRKTKFITTNLYASAADLTKGEKKKIKNETINYAIENLVRSYREKCNKYSATLQDMSVSEVVELLTATEPESFDLDIIAFGREVARKLDATGRKGNARIYNIALNSLCSYIGRESMSVHELTKRFLKKYIEDMPGPRAKSLYPATLRAIYNRAKEDYNDEERGKILIPYSPFSGLKMKPPVARKRAITLEQMQRIIQLPYKETNLIRSGEYIRFNLAKDIYILSFALAGMNVADLYDCIRYEDGRIVYERKKTRSRREDRAQMSIKIPAQVMGLFNKYKDKTGKRVFEFYQHYLYANTMTDNLNKALKHIGAEVGVPGLDMYSARHTFATLARNECEFPMDRVAQALNHVESEHKVTDLYVKKSWKAVDEIQEKVMELVWNIP